MEVVWWVCNAVPVILGPSNDMKGEAYFECYLFLSVRIERSNNHKASAVLRVPMTFGRLIQTVAGGNKLPPDSGGAAQVLS